MTCRIYLYITGNIAGGASLTLKYSQVVKNIFPFSISRYVKTPPSLPTQINRSAHYG